MNIVYIVETLTERDGTPITVDAHLKQSVMSCRPDIELGDNPPPHLPASRLRLPAADGQNGRNTESAGHSGPSGTFLEQPHPMLDWIVREQEDTVRTKPLCSVTDL